MRPTINGRLMLFFALVLPALCLVPAVNVLKAPKRDVSLLLRRSVLFNVDFASRALAGPLYELGLSIDPQQVVVGPDGWLHLGDQYNRTLTRDRTRLDAHDLATVRQLHAAAAAWDQRLASYGVKWFRIMVAPNKGGIYPETLPKWAKPVGPDLTDALLNNQPAPLYIDARAALLSARTKLVEPLYYSTDTHWNELGAAVAFREFARQLAPVAPELRWPAEQVLALARVEPRGGGDLAGFLRRADSLSDFEPRIALDDRPLKTTQIDFDSGRTLREGDNAPIDNSFKPLLVNSPSALNDKKLLWVRDSFGQAMSPLVAATFRHTLQIHPGRAFEPGGELLRLVESWKPDYVFVTVVQRDVSSEMAHFPLPILTRQVTFDALATARRPATQLGTQTMTAGHTAGEWLTHGDFPALQFGWSDSDLAPPAHWMALNLRCPDGSQAVSARLTWPTSPGGTKSAELLLPTGYQAVDLRSLPGWSDARSLRSFSLTLDTRQGCRRFKLDAPLLISLPTAPN